MEKTRYSIHIARLIVRKAAGRINAEGEAEIDRWLAESEANRKAYAELLDATTQKHHFDKLHQKNTNAAFNRVRERYLRTRRKRKLFYLLPYAAAVAVLALAVGFWLASDVRTFSGGEQLTTTEILPGGNKATLTLADGRTIDLSESQTGIIVGDEDITYNDGSNLEQSYLKGGEARSTALLSLTTPKGGTYQITLPDGSQVWLNANSTLKYPSRFTGDSREVILEGEAYFEIQEIQGTRDTRAPAHNSDGARYARLPFKVQTSGQTVEVLGTEFNISAYTDNPETKTTLVEGKVRVETNAASLQLEPGEQGTAREGMLTKTDVNTEKYTAWRNGQFRFTGETLGGAMQQIARWYAIDVVFTDESLGHVPVAGIINRDEQLSVLLGLFERVGDIHFELDNRKLTISRK